MSFATTVDLSKTATDLAFFGVTSGTSAVLRENHEYIMGLLPGALDKFYKHVTAFEATHQYFRDASHIAHAKQMQLKHWSVIVSGRFDGEYVQSVTRIGEVHNKIGLEPKWYIGGYNFLLTELIAQVSRDFRPSLGRSKAGERSLALIQALTQAVMVDMNFAISVYIEASRRDRADTLSQLADQFESTVGALTSQAGKAASFLKCVCSA